MTGAWFVFALFPLILGAESIAAVQGTRGALSTLCPKAGTQVEIRAGVRIFDRVFTGADSSDPSLCRFKNDNRATSSLYYGILARNVSVEERSKFGSLVEGSSTEFLIVTTVKIITATGHTGPAEVERRWKRLGLEEIKIAGKAVPAVAFEATTESRTGHIYQTVQRLWFDPSLRIWIKSQTISSHGIREPVDWEVNKFK